MVSFSYRMVSLHAFRGAGSLLLALLAQTIYANQLDGSAAELALRDSSGQSHSLEDYRGKIVVLNFWATWCIPCREEMPLLVSVHDRYAARGVVVIGASADGESTQAQIAPFLAKLKITFPVWIGANTAHMEKLGLGTGLPATAFIDRDGRIVGRILGVLGKKDLQHRIEYLLGDRRGPPPAPLVDRTPKGHEHEGEEHHQHGGVSMEGASTVPS